MSEEIKKIKVIHDTVAGGAVWFAGSVLRIGFDVDADEARSLLSDGLAAVVDQPSDDEDGETPEL